jgi:UDP-N-acetyl-D-galactosamine dehydrogenase
MRDLIISVTGLGYVGLPIVAAMAKKYKVIAFDLNLERIKDLRGWVDRNGEVNSEELKSENIIWASPDTTDLRTLADFHIVTVPTPIDEKNKPDLSLLGMACQDLGSVIKNGDTIVFESTVYPGCTRDFCLPILEQYAHPREVYDFSVGYSPERINPGDTRHTFTKIAKVVSGDSDESLNQIASVYRSVIDAEIYKAESIEIAEFSKIIENTQRDVNIALMNECMQIADKMGVPFNRVLAAARTKWNFCDFHPGLVGGHCIGVDPYYLADKALKVGVSPDIILAGRQTNNNMGSFIAIKAIEMLVKKYIDVQDARVLLMGLTFKENCPDLRNSRALDIYRKLIDHGADVLIHDPIADRNEIKKTYGQTPIEYLPPNVDLAIIATPHQYYLDRNSLISAMPMVLDVRAKLEKPEGHKFWWST